MTISTVSVVLPLYNEELLVGELINRVGDAVAKISCPVEIIIVDDGSKDNTLAILLSAREKNKQIKVISLSRNFGLQAAIMAGLEYAEGDSIVVMDGDLQDPPELIPELVHMLEKDGIDLVVGRRIARSERWPKRVFINLFHKIVEPQYTANKNYDTGNFCIVKRAVLNGILNAQEKQRYFPGLRSFTGFKTDYLDYERQDRDNSKSKMTYRKLISMAGDALFSFSKWPVRLCLVTGSVSLIVMLIALIYTLVSKIIDLAPIGWSSTFISIYVFGTFQLLFLGIIGEYIYRVYKEVQNRPHYIIRKIYQ